MRQDKRSAVITQSTKEKKGISMEHKLVKRHHIKNRFLKDSSAFYIKDFGIVSLYSSIYLAQGKFNYYLLSPHNTLSSNISRNIDIGSKFLNQSTVNFWWFRLEVFYSKSDFSFQSRKKTPKITSIQWYKVRSTFQKPLKFLQEKIRASTKVERCIRIWHTQKVLNHLIWFYMGAFMLKAQGWRQIVLQLCRMVDIWLQCFMACWLDKGLVGADGLGS